jgi:hypothetical protein
MLTFTLLDDQTAIGGPAPDGWTPITARPLLVLVGVTGAGKSTTLDALAAAGLGCRLLPDRRLLTDLLMIPQMQLAAGKPVAPVHDRKERFALTRAYRERYPGGMGHALAQLLVDGAPPSQFTIHNSQFTIQLRGARGEESANLLLFDGLRGENEVRHAAQALPLARFVMLDAPDVVRVARLMGRNDPFDQLATAAGRPAPPQRISPRWAHRRPSGCSPRRRKPRCCTWRRQPPPATICAAAWPSSPRSAATMTPAATRAALLAAAPDRALVIDTAAHAPAAVAQQILALLEGRGAGGAPIRTPNVSEGAGSDPFTIHNSQFTIHNSIARGEGRGANGRPRPLLKSTPPSFACRFSAN